MSAHDDWFAQVADGVKEMADIVKPTDKPLATWLHGFRAGVKASKDHVSEEVES